MQAKKPAFVSAIGFVSGLASVVGYATWQRPIAAASPPTLGLLLIASRVGPTVPTTTSIASWTISTILGVVFAEGLSLALRSPSDFAYAGFYASALAFFHFSEFLTTSVYNPTKLTLDSYLLNHSKEYVGAAVISWIEFGLEYLLVPRLKSLTFVSMLGLIFVVFGEVLRKVAMCTAGSNFSHVIAYRKARNHELVTHGVYSLCRHPSYVGWFYWSIGTQLVLVNPLCVVFYAIVSWKFFKERIEDEDMTLLLFFRKEYYDYQRRVRTGLPFIDGHRLTSKEMTELGIDE